MGNNTLLAKKQQTYHFCTSNDRIFRRQPVREAKFQVSQAHEETNFPFTEQMTMKVPQ